MTVYGPDGRMWTIGRGPEAAGLAARLTPGPWIVQAVASDDEVRRWRTDGRRSAAALVVEVALALRTGAEGPPGELPPERPATGGAAGDDQTGDGPHD